MADLTKCRIQAGALVFEMEGTEKFVNDQMNKHRDHIDTILAEQVKIVKSGKAQTTGRRGRPAKAGVTKRGAAGGRKPGRQPVIVRQSDLKLKTRDVAALKKFMAATAGQGKLGKDASVFVTAYFLCTQVIKKDTFSAGDVSNALAQVGSLACLPDTKNVDVVQMLRNLAASSIGKQWVSRNADGTFSLTAKGHAAGKSGQVSRPRGRRPSKEVKAPKAAKKAKAVKATAPKKAKAVKAAAPKKAVKKAVAKKAVRKTAKKKA